MKFIWNDGGEQESCSVCEDWQMPTTLIDGVPYCGMCLAEKLAGQLKDIGRGLGKMKASIDKYEGSKCSKPENS